MTELILPMHMAKDLDEARIKADFKPFFRYACSICIVKYRLEFQKFLISWLRSMEKVAYDSLRKEFFTGIPPIKAALPKAGKNPRHLSRIAVAVAHDMTTMFQTHKKEPLPSKLVSLGG